MPVLKELKGQINAFWFDCDHPEVTANKVSFSQIGSCDVQSNPTRQASMILVRQPEVRKNPYTGEPMRIESTGFPPGAVDKKVFKKWITDFIPDFSIKIQSQD